MELKFDAMKDLLDFTKKALYMTDKKVLHKILKWKKRGELICHGDNEGYTLLLNEEVEIDKEFNEQMLKKYSNWLASGKQGVL